MTVNMHVVAIYLVPSDFYNYRLKDIRSVGFSEHLVSLFIVNMWYFNSFLGYGFESLVLLLIIDIINKPLKTFST
jgi:hypothetical protein